MHAFRGAAAGFGFGQKATYELVGPPPRRRPAPRRATPLKNEQS